MAGAAADSRLEALLQRHMVLYSRFPAEIRDVIRRFIPLFLKGKQFEGKNGLEAGELHRVLVAANAALVGGAQRVSCFDCVRWILLYPNIPHIDGEAFTASKVVLSWECVKEESQHPEAAGNLVVHEFAHVLDHLLGVSHSTEGMVAAFEACEARLAEGADSVFRSEDLESPEEFFCAASEIFFTRPAWLAATYPALYRDLVGLYGLEMERYLPD